MRIIFLAVRDDKSSISRRFHHYCRHGHHHSREDADCAALLYLMSFLMPRPSIDCLTYFKAYRITGDATALPLMIFVIEAATALPAARPVFDAATKRASAAQAMLYTPRSGRAHH